MPHGRVDNLQAAVKGPEEGLLLGCARAAARPDQSRHLEPFLGSAINWDHLMQLVWFHGVAPFLNLHVQATAAPPVPGKVQEALQEEVRANARRSLWLSRELITLLKSFETHGIRAVPVKGPVLGEMLYGNASLRPFGDLDVLIPRNEIRAAARVIAGQGYRPENQRVNFLEERQHRAGLPGNQHHLRYLHEDGRQVVELHWSLVPGYFPARVHFQKTWDRLKSTTFGGMAIRTLPAEDLLLFLCIHGAKHQWTRLKWICDVAALIRISPDLDWEAFEGAADANGCRRMSLLGVFLAGKALGAAVPGSLLARANGDAPVQRRYRGVFRGISRALSSPPGPLSRFLFHLDVQDGPGRGIQYGIRRALIPNGKDLRHLPLPGIFSAVPGMVVRPFRIAGELLAGRVKQH